MNTKPAVDFIFVGPSKTASTWVFDILRSHPEVFVPAAKDIYFFDRFYEKGLAWYESFFPETNKALVQGELSHDYFSNAAAIHRIYAYNPKIKLICCLRNPFDRAYSSFQHRQRLGLAKGSFAEDILHAPEIEAEGLYNTHLSKILSTFKSDAVLILDFDDLTVSPKLFAEQIYKFLRVDSSFEPHSLNTKVNQARDSRSVLLSRLIKVAAVLVRNLGFANVVGRVKHSRWVNNLIYKQVKAERVKNDAIVYPPELVETYNNELRQLSILLERSYIKWENNM
jgi:Sulfotransferase domain